MRGLTLVDTSAFVAAACPGETLHRAMVDAFTEASAAGSLATPVTVVTETMCLMRARFGVDAQRRFWSALGDSGLEVIPADDELLALVHAIDARYADAGFGFVDSTLLAACEQMRCARVLSLDRRFVAYRPSFTEALEVLP